MESPCSGTGSSPQPCLGGDRASFPRDRLVFGSCRNESDFETIGDRIGSGMYGDVFLARDRATLELRAIKRVRIDPNSKEGIPVTTLREIMLLKQLRHENVVRLYEVAVGHRANRISLVFEYAEHDLSALIAAKRTFTPAQTKSLLRQLMSAVAYVHSRFIIHRDIKLSNILYTGNGVVKLADFGFARPLGEPRMSERLTHNVVTLWYRSPELLLGLREYTKAVDMWSVGCVMAELVLCKPLLPGNSEMEQLALIWKTLGDPSRRWPKWRELPDAKRVRIVVPEVPSSPLCDRFRQLGDDGVHMLESLLAYDPEHRITARAALTHRWWRSFPPPTPPDQMPKFPVHTKEELRSSRNERTALASSGGVGSGTGRVGGPGDDVTVRATVSGSAAAQAAARAAHASLSLQRRTAREQSQSQRRGNGRGSGSGSGSGVKRTTSTTSSRPRDHAVVSDRPVKRPSKQ